MRTIFCLFIIIGFCALSPFPAYSESLSGVVTDKETGDTMAGVAVYVKNTTIGVLTNGEGKWTIHNILSGDAVLVFQMAGFKTVELNADEKTASVQLEPSMFNMGEIVVTGTATHQLYENTPVKTELVPKYQIENIQETDLYGVLQYTPGLRVENKCQNCGFSWLRMLGLEGGYSQVLVNGDPVVSTMAGVYGLQQFPEQMIESLEVVKGGGSALYGANAIGGVVNVKLRRPMINRGGISLDYKSVESHSHAETGFYSEMVSESMNYGVFVFGNARNQNGYDRDDDGFTEIGRNSSETLGLNLYVKTSKNGELTGYLHHIHEDRRGGDSLTKPSHQALISEAAESERWGGNLKYSHTVNKSLALEGAYTFALADRDTYYGANQDPNAYGRTENPTHIFSGKANYYMGSHLATVGFMQTYEHLRDEASGYNRIIDDEYTDFGFFVQDQVTFSGRYTLVAGARADKHSLLDSPVISPRLSALVKLSEDLKLRGSVSTGFKPPQVFDEDLHITQVNGEGQVIRNSDDLKEESSISFSGTLDFMKIIGPHGIQAGITGFHTILKDQFQTIDADDPSTDQLEFIRQNGDGLRVSGIELQAGYQTRRSCEIQGSFTFQSDTLDSAEPDFGSTRLFRTPKKHGTLTAFWYPEERLSFFAGLTYTGSMNVPHYAGYIDTDRLETSDPFLTIDAGTTIYLKHAKSGKGDIKLNLGVKNISDSYQKDFDKGVDRDAGYVYGPGTPRMWYAGVNFGM